MKTGTVIEELITRYPELEARHAWIDDLVQRIPTPILALDDEGTVLAANPAARRFFGRDPGQLVDEDLGLPAVEDDAMLQFRTPEGLLRWGQMRTLSAGAHDEGVHLVTVEDRTQPRKVEDLHRRLAFLGSVLGHDLKEPIRMIRSFIDLTEREAGDQLDGDAREFFDIVKTGADRLTDRLDALRNYTRAVHADTELEPVDLDSVVEDGLSNVELLLQHEDVEVSREQLPTVHGDRTMLSQYVQNLVVNAIEHKDPDQPVHVQVTANRSGTTWRFSVADDGPGIPDETREQISAMLEGGTEDSEHAGLGLAICATVAERHGTKIELDTEVGEGTRFTIELLDASASGLETH